MEVDTQMMKFLDRILRSTKLSTKDLIKGMKYSTTLSTMIRNIIHSL